jgi:hypothetical protein
MTVHQCPKCELRFDRNTELDDHCRQEHPQFHHDYPVHGRHHNDAPAADATGTRVSGSAAPAPQSRSAPR